MSINSNNPSLDADHVSTATVNQTPSPRQAFQVLVRQHQRAVYTLAMDLTGNHHDAEDLAQEVFLKAHRAWASFRGEATPHTWLRRIAVNTFLNQRRKKALTFMRLFGDLGERQWGEEGLVSPDRAADGALVRASVAQALNTLSPKERTAFVLRYHEDLTVKAIANHMACAEGTVKSLLFRATKKLQKALAPLRAEVEA